MAVFFAFVFSGSTSFLRGGASRSVAFFHVRYPRVELRISIGAGLGFATRDTRVKSF
jgi:hypothetical protein